jgi:hypothetical protein
VSWISGNAKAEVRAKQGSAAGLSPEKILHLTESSDEAVALKALEILGHRSDAWSKRMPKVKLRRSREALTLFDS